MPTNAEQSTIEDIDFRRSCYKWKADNLAAAAAAVCTESGYDISLTALRKLRQAMNDCRSHDIETLRAPDGYQV